MVLIGWLFMFVFLVLVIMFCQFIKAENRANEERSCRVLVLVFGMVLLCPADVSVRWWRQATQVVGLSEAEPL